VNKLIVWSILKFRVTNNSPSEKSCNKHCPSRPTERTKDLLDPSSSKLVTVLYISDSLRLLYPCNGDSNCVSGDTLEVGSVNLRLNVLSAIEVSKTNAKADTAPSSCPSTILNGTNGRLQVHNPITPKNRYVR
jgi:hypothetical protein